MSIVFKSIKINVCYGKHCIVKLLKLLNGFTRAKVHFRHNNTN